MPKRKSEKKSEKKPFIKPLKVNLNYQLKWQNLDIGSHDYVYQANEAELLQIATRLELRNINYFKADMCVIRKNKYEFILQGSAVADYQQESVMTLNEMPVNLPFDFTIELLYQAPQQSNNKKEIIVYLDESEIFTEDFLPLVDYLVQEFILNLPLSPEYIKK